MTALLKDQLLRSLATGEEYRHAFVEEKIRTGLAVQIKAIREQRKLNQTQFARMMNKSQSWVSRLEDPNQPIPMISTLLLVGRTFDVDLDVRFVPFSEMLSRLSRLTPAGFEVKSFDEELKSRSVLGEDSMNDLTVDNRPTDEMLSYYEARIEALAHRVQELEAENIILRNWREEHAEELEKIR